MGLAMAGMSLGGFLVAPIAGFLNASLGWRITFGIMGGTAGLVLLPLIALMVRSAPSPAQLPTRGEAPHTPRGNSLLRHPAFWLVTASFALVGLSFVGILTHLVIFLEDSGMNPVTAAGTLGVVAGMSTLGRPLSGYLSDRVSHTWVAGLTAVLQGTGLLVLMLSQTPQAIWAFAVVFGLGLGAAPVVRPLLLGNFFGSGAFGTNYGWMMLFIFLGSAAGPPFAGYIYDTTGSYTVAFTTFILAYAASVPCLLLARRLRPSQEGPRPT